MTSPEVGSEMRADKIAVASVLCESCTECIRCCDDRGFDEAGCCTVV